MLIHFTYDYDKIRRRQKKTVAKKMIALSPISKCHQHHCYQNGYHSNLWFKPIQVKKKRISKKVRRHKARKDGYSEVPDSESAQMGRIKRHRVVPLRYSSSKDWNDVKIVIIILRYRIEDLFNWNWTDICQTDCYEHGCPDRRSVTVRSGPWSQFSGPDF